MVLSTVSRISHVPQPHHSLWNQPWVQNILPLATSLLLHAGIIAAGIALYHVTRQVSNPNRDQVIIPQMSSIDRPVWVPPANRQIIAPEFQPYSGDDQTHLDPKNNFPLPPGESGVGDAAPFDAPRVSGPGINPFKPLTGDGMPWRGPGGDGGFGPGVTFMQQHGSARKVVYLCDASGSMLGVFGQLKQQLRESISGLDVLQDQEFNVIFFSDDNVFSLFKDGPQIASADNKKLAIDFIDNAVSTGGTQPLPAIRFAMNQKPELIYLLTDGFDQIANTDDVTRAFKAGNSDGKIHVNCIFLQSDEDPKLEAVLRQIASDSHGDFKKVLKSDM